MVNASTVAAIVCSFILNSPMTSKCWRRADRYHKSGSDVVVRMNGVRKDGAHHERLCFTTRECADRPAVLQLAQAAFTLMSRARIDTRAVFARAVGDGSC